MGTNVFTKVTLKLLAGVTRLNFTKPTFILTNCTSYYVQINICLSCLRMVQVEQMGAQSLTGPVNHRPNLLINHPCVAKGNVNQASPPFTCKDPLQLKRIWQFMLKWLQSSSTEVLTFSKWFILSRIWYQSPRTGFATFSRGSCLYSHKTISHLSGLVGGKKWGGLYQTTSY